MQASRDVRENYVGRNERNSKHPPKVQTSTHAIMPYEFTFSLMEAFISTSSFEIMSFI